MNKGMQVISKAAKQIASWGKKKAALLGFRGFILAVVVLVLCIFQSVYVHKIQDYTMLNVTYNTVTEVIIFLAALLFCQFISGEGWRISLKTVLLMGFPLLIMFAGNIIVQFQGQHMQIYGGVETNVQIGMYSVTVNPWLVIIPIAITLLLIAVENGKLLFWALYHICGIVSCIFIWGSSIIQMGIAPLLITYVAAQCVLAYAALWLLKNERYIFSYMEFDDFDEPEYD